MDWGENGSGENWKNEWYVLIILFSLHFIRGSTYLGEKAYIPYDQQLGQMYELMQAIRKKQDDDLNSEK